MNDFVSEYVTFPDVLAAHRRAADAVTALAGRLDQSRLDEPSGLGGWTVRRLVSHLADIDDIYATFAESGAIPTTMPEYDDPVAAVAEHAERARRAFAAPGYLETVTPTPIGPFPGSVTVQHVTNELLAHGLDLARGIGDRLDVDDADLEASLASWRAFFATYPRSMMDSNFADESNAPNTASATDRLLAYLGRDI